MPSETTYTSLRRNLASVLDQVVDQQETAHLLRSPRNARRLQSALRRAQQGRTKPSTAAALRREILGEARS